jgi:uncharacterized protein YbbC (DUF1343 family)
MIGVLNFPLFLDKRCFAMNSSVFKKIVSLSQKYIFALVFLLFGGILACKSQTIQNTQGKLEIKDSISVSEPILPGAYQTSEYITLLGNKNVAVVTNHTGFIENTHLVDSLISLNINIVKIFSPEHGFRGTADAGAKVLNSKDTKTGIEIISLYGKNKKPTNKQLKGVDVVLFDIQDVGVRFYTYISTLEYVMEACAESNKEVIVLDRPNPNIHYTDGPILNKQFQSFIGRQSIPIVYGLTIGEYANMIKGENWFNKSSELKLTVIKNKNYTRDSEYILPIAPSPNLKSQNSIYLYPSLCLLESTVWSVGRGTDTPFEIYGHPDDTSKFVFIPESNQGASNPKFKGKVCHGFDLTADNSSKPYSIDLKPLFYAYKMTKNKDSFFLSNFDLITGCDYIKEDLKQGVDYETTANKWKTELETYNKTRIKYFLYE